MSQLSFRVFQYNCNKKATAEALGCASSVSRLILSFPSLFRPSSPSSSSPFLSVEGRFLVGMLSSIRGVGKESHAEGEEKRRGPFERREKKEGRKEGARFRLGKKRERPIDKEEDLGSLLIFVSLFTYAELGII